MKLRVSGLVAGFVLLAAFPAWANDHAIRLHRPAKAGDKFRLTIQNSTESRKTVWVDGAKAEDTTKEEQLKVAGELRILEVQRGTPTKMEFKVQGGLLPPYD